MSIVNDQIIIEPFQQTINNTDEVCPTELMDQSNSFLDVDWNNFTIPKITNRTGRNTKDQLENDTMQKREIVRRHNMDLTSQVEVTGRQKSYRTGLRVENNDRKQDEPQKNLNLEQGKSDFCHSYAESQSDIKFLDREDVCWDKYYLESQSYTFVFKNECNFLSFLINI